MIPLNKPLIISSHKGINLDEFLKSRYFNKYYEIVLSARQGLSIIYKHLYDKYGKCRVAVSPLTCFEALYPILNNNHEIVFVDIDTATLNMDISSIPDNVDIIQPIHLGGNPMNIKEVLKIAKDINALIVEDCAQALGAQYDGQHLGFNSDFAVFNLMKNIFALGGGYILSSTEINTPNFKSLGFIETLYRIIKRRFEAVNSINTRMVEYSLLALINLKSMPNPKIHNNKTINKIIYKSAAIQLSSFKYLLEKRIKNAQYILSSINNFMPQKVLPKSKPNFTRLFFLSKEEKARCLIQKLRKKGIWANNLTQNTLIPYQETVFQNIDFRKYALQSHNLTNYRDVHDRIISIPISPALKESEMDYMIKEINKL